MSSGPASRLEGTQRKERLWRSRRRHERCRRKNWRKRIRTTERIDANGGSIEHTMTRGLVGFASVAYMSRYPAIWRIEIGATALWTSSWRETREATAA